MVHANNAGMELGEKPQISMGGILNTYQKLVPGAIIHPERRKQV